MLSKRVALISMFTSLAVVGRISLMIVPNISLVTPFTILSAIIGGPYEGFLVGLLSMVISDLYIGIGPWTLFTSLSMGFIGFLSGILIKRMRDLTLIFISTYLLVLSYDILTSILTMLLFNIPPLIAIINLFIPVFIGSIPYPMGPVHELSASLITTYLIKYLRSCKYLEVYMNV